MIRHKSRLKPCPFCGHEIAETIGFCDIRLYRCYGCGAIISFNNIKTTKDPGIAFKYYNRRYSNGKDD